MLKPLFAVIIGGLVIGAAMAWFIRHSEVDPLWKLLIITGLCGGLTTFSSLYRGIHGVATIR